MKSLFLVLTLVTLHGVALTQTLFPPIWSWYELSEQNVTMESYMYMLTGSFGPNRHGEEAASWYSVGGPSQDDGGGILLASDWEISGEFTFSFWVMPERAINLVNEYTSCSSASVPLANSNQNWVLVPPNGGASAFGVGLSVGTNGIQVAEHGTNQLICPISHSVEISGFHLVTVTYSTELVSLYLDGQLLESRDIPCPSRMRFVSLPVDGEPTYIRIGGGFYSDHFAGSVDALGTWIAAWSSENVQAAFEYDTPFLPGCTDYTACNYKYWAETDNGSCVYADEGYDCDGTCIELDLDGDGVCDFSSAEGCQMSFISADAVGSCDPFMDVDMDVLGVPAVGPDGAMQTGSRSDSASCGESCWSATKTFATHGIDTIHVHTMQHRFHDASYVYGEDGTLLWSWHGVNESATWYEDDHVVPLDGNESITMVFHDGYGDNSFCLGYMMVTEVVCAEDAICSEPTACNFNGAAPCIFPADIDACDCSGSTEDVCGICGGDGSTCTGCTNAQACNFNPNAFFDDGSCLGEDALLGCIDEAACNFNNNAQCDDGTCIYPVVGADCFEGSSLCANGTWWHPIEQKCQPHPCFDCPGNFDNDELITISDLIGLLSVFGQTCFSEGCTDLAACNFSSIATVDDGSCVYPFLDACGCFLDCSGAVLNDMDGDGICDNSPAVGCSDQNACNYTTGACIYSPESCIYGTEEPGTPCDDGNASTFNDVWNETGCACAGTLAVNPAGSGPCAGEASLIYQGHSYDLVEIGDQCWFRDNLQALTYANGDSIPLHLPSPEWTATTSGAAAYFEESEDLLNEWGAFYNAFAVFDERGLCPSGWHVASDEDFQAMELFTGVPEAELATTGWRGSDQGYALDQNIDEFGFRGKRAGNRTGSGFYYSINLSAYLWSNPVSSTTASDTLFFRELNNTNPGVGRQLSEPNRGLSVRCIQ